MERDLFFAFLLECDLSLTVLSSSSLVLVLTGVVGSFGESNAVLDAEIVWSSLLAGTVGDSNPVVEAEIV